MEKTTDKVRLATRTYLYNIIQASAKTLFLIDFTSKIHLEEVGIKVAHPGSTYLEGLGLPENPFEEAHARAFVLGDSSPDIDLLVSSLPNSQQAEWFSMRRRFYTIIVSNVTPIVDKVLSELELIEKKPPSSVVYVNYFLMDIKVILDNFDAVAQYIKETLGKSIDEETLTREMRWFLAGLRLCRLLSAENNETYLLKRGYSELLSKYPFMDKMKDPKLFLELKRPQALPNEILDSYIYLGNGRHVKYELLRQPILT